MRNYKALKAAGKVSVAKVKVVDRVKVDEVKYKDGDDIPAGLKVGDIKTGSQPEMSHEELQVVSKRYDSNTGESQDDSVRAYSLSDVKSEIDRRKSQITKLESEQADLEELEKDLKAL